MPNVTASTQPWGVIVDRAGNVRRNVAYTVTDSGGATILSGTTNSDGEIAGTIAPGSYTLTVLGESFPIEAASGSTPAVNPSGPAGGKLAGTYPNPDLAAASVGTTELADGAVTGLKVNSALKPSGGATDGTEALREVTTGTTAGKALSAAAPRVDTVQDEGSSLPQRSAVDFQGAGVTVTDGTTKTIVTIPGSAGTVVTTVEDEGTPLTNRTNVNFTGAGVTAADSGGKTVVTIPGTAGAAYATVEDEGGALTQRSNVNFTGAGVTAVDAGGKTVVTIPGGTTFLAPPFAAAQAASNTPLSTSTRRIMYRWVARKTGNISKLHHAAVVGVSGYGAGTSGVWEATTYAVDATTGLPTGAAVRQETGIVPSSRVSGGVGYVDMTKNGGATPGNLAVTKGDEYATVWRNTDASPSANFASLNNFWHEDYRAAGETDYLYGVYGAQARNERSSTASDSYYGFDPREVLGTSSDSGTNWNVPSGGYNTTKSYKEIPCLVQEYADGTKWGQPYYSGTRGGFTDNRWETMVYNIKRSQAFTHIGAFILGYSPYHTPNGTNTGSTTVYLLVNDVVKAQAHLTGPKFKWASLGTTVNVVNTDVVKIRYRYDSTGANGCSFLHQYTDMNTLLGTGTSYEWYLEGSSTYAVPIWPLPYLKQTD